MIWRARGPLLKAGRERADAKEMTDWGDCATPPLPQSGAAAGRGVPVPPPVPVRVVPVSEFNPPDVGSAGSVVVGIVALALAGMYLAGTFWLVAARRRPGGGAPTTTDLVLACAVFPLSLVVGAGLLCLSIIAVFCTRAWRRGCAVLAAMLDVAAFFVAVPGK